MPCCQLVLWTQPRSDFEFGVPSAGICEAPPARIAVSHETMKSTLTFLLLLCLGFGAPADGNGVRRRPKEPTGGLTEIALQPSELSPEYERRVRLSLDPSAKPPTYLYDIPGMSRSSGQDQDPIQRFRREMVRVGAEAVIYLAYDAPPTASYVKILRFPSAIEAERQWALRSSTGESQVVAVAGVEVLFTRPGKMLRADLRAGFNTLECRAGKYWIRVAPAKPEPGDLGLNLALKQLEKIAKVREPAVH